MACFMEIDKHVLDSLRMRFSIRNRNKRHCKYADKRLYAITPTGLFNYGMAIDILHSLRSSYPGIHIQMSDDLRNIVYPFSYPIMDIVEPVNPAYGYRDYQRKAIQMALANGRGIIKSPTASGKSLILYGIMTNVIRHNPNIRNILLLVPTIQLVRQMYSDFGDYGMDMSKMQMFSAFKPELGPEPVVIANRQYLEEHSSELKTMDMVIVDETHQLKRGNCVSDYVQSLTTPVKFGLTGTLPDNVEDVWNVKGIIGPLIFNEEIVSLQKRKFLTEVSILPIQIRHKDIPAEIYEPIVFVDDKGNEKLDFSQAYHREWQFLEEKGSANDAIARVIEKLRGNSIVLFSHTEHGNSLFEKLRMKNKMFIDGSIDIDVREDIRALMEVNDDCCLVGQCACVSTGINIKNISNIVFVNMCKSVVRVVQSIGRGLRPRDGKEKVNIIDIYHNARYSEKHFANRKRIYMKSYGKTVDTKYFLEI